MNNITMKPIPSYPDYYASADGHIYNKHGKELKPFANNVGYYLVGIWQGGQRLGRLVHRLVAETWMADFNPDLEINHIDEDKANNDITNLEQLSHRDNLVYGTRIRRMVLKRLKPVRCIETGEEWECAKQAAEALGHCREQIRLACRSGQLYKGYHFEYIDKDNN